MISPQSVGAIFDMDGVLVDSADAHFKSWRELGLELGVEITRAQFAETFGRQNRDIIPLRFGVYDDRRIRELAAKKEELYRGLVRERPPIVPGAVELVTALAQRGVRLAVGSSGPQENIDLILAAMGVAGAIEVVVSADQVQRGKPDPQVFALACEGLGLAPHRCVVVEDAPAGVEAAKRAGCRCIAVMVHHSREALARADLVVLRLNDLKAEDVLRLGAAAG